ncbi:hypothetical protein MMU07_02630 [Aquiflexum sp. LQ15W]|uniref:hypothetical protein n=1 Tax=Cognataquiflexum nitidum TaxID=2922272 RepID=UPI001F138DFE|nr:hypothetical protein [Cognataquiflexum nitidum]MCH6198460.1 hypothetical protein [Cognataquiflexum nitidum]
MEIGPNGILNITGNITQTSQTTANIKIDGGELNIAGSLIVNAGANNGTKTLLNIDLKNNGVFNVTGRLDLKGNTQTEVTGDDSFSMEVGLIELAQKAFLNIRLGGGVISYGETNYAGNDSEINVWGFFRTESIKVSGGSGKQLNTFGSAEVVVDGNVRVDGSGRITFGGDSDVYIDGDVILNGADDRLIIKDNAKVVVCGENTQTSPAPPTVDKDGLNECSDPNNCPNGGFYVSCRVLPVEMLYCEAKISSFERNTNLYWATAKEVNNSHFEIERSVDGIKEFQKVGEIRGMGSKESITEYAYVDNNLPLTGGNIFYRLKQVDFDGKHTYSKVLSVKVSNIQYSKGVWRAYPNPTMGDQLKINLLDGAQYKRETITFRIIHPSYTSEAVAVDSEYSLNEYLSRLLPGIPSGLFVIEVSWGDKVEHIKVLKKG